MTITINYHFHVYFDPETRAAAEKVIAAIADKFDILVGSFHDKPVGPHPVGSCLLTVDTSNFGAVMDWLAKNRDGLTIFIHVNTDNEWKDHTDHTIWMGEMMALNPDVLRKFAEINQKAP
jgi:aromatic ring-cleaving dioxygenase